MLVASGEATEYASAQDAFDAVDRLESEVDLRLRALAEASPGAKAFALSALADHERDRRARVRLRRRLALPPSSASAARPSASGLTSLEALRAAQEGLVHAHAEGLPALRDPFSVQVMAGHMVELSRQLTVIDLWLESESSRG